jgi:protein O-GlcNAcase/histone acetyltransferase
LPLTVLFCVAIHPCLSMKAAETPQSIMLESRMTCDPLQSRMPGLGETEDKAGNDGGSRPFLCGVVEGFYGRPWTLSQRKDLFEKMEEWGMTSYLYAPKDDCKHRAFWRELYTVEEADHLQSLISTAHASNVDFYYALSPGLDIAYSNSKEVATLKRKLDQVSQLGCKAFALLFDDIEAEMSKPDKEAFQSFAAAQVSVTNEIYQHLGQPKFLFCPTQYCTTRAVPTIATSEYLKTIGSKLAPDIDVMWTGDKVIPKDITIASLEEITMVLKRAPVIWDNEHANDYDQRRVYLGPYSGRSPDIIPKLRGVLTNPNCEYGANFVAIHSLAAWSFCTVDGCSSLSPHDPVSADIKLELDREGGDGGTSTVPPPPEKLPPHVYHPRHALRSAVTAWLPEFQKPKSMWGPLTKPQVGLNPLGTMQPTVNTCMTSTATTSSVNMPIPCTSVSSTGNVSQPSISSGETNNVTLVVWPGLPPGPVVSPGVVAMHIPIMNSFVSQHEVVSDRPELVKPVQFEPMDDTPTSPQAMDSMTNPSTPATGELSSPPTPAAMQVEVEGMTKSESTTMLCDQTAMGDQEDLEDLEDPGLLTVTDLELICDLFYLPCEHGPQALHVLTEFYWLKTHAGCMRPDGEEDPSNVNPSEWTKRRDSFAGIFSDIKNAFEKICGSPNRELVYNVYTYIWDMVGVLSMLVSYVDWLALGNFSPHYKQLVVGRHTWFSGIREAFVSGDHEPWVFRGGLTADLQRLMPVDSGNDLFLYTYPESPTPEVFHIRPYRHEDKEVCYSICLKTWDDGMDASPYYTSHPSLVGDKSIGPFLTFSPGLGFVFENTLGQIVGYIFSAPNLKEFHQQVTGTWLPELRKNYPAVELGEGELLTPCDLTVNSLHRDLLPLAIEEPETYGVCKLAMLGSLPVASLARRAMTLLLACLRTAGTLKVVSEVLTKERYMTDLYTKLGFTPRGPVTVTSPEVEAPSLQQQAVFMFRRY